VTGAADDEIIMTIDFAGTGPTKVEDVAFEGRMSAAIGGHVVVWRRR